MFRRFFARLAVLVLALVPLAVVGSAPAQAHDTLRQSIPQNGARTEPIEAISLVFSAKVLATGAAVEVTGPSGAAVDGAPQIADALVTQKVKTPLAAGEYNVRWRVLSSDGHPISGTFKFTVVSTQAPNASSQAANASTQDATPAPSSSAPTPPVQQVPTDSTNNSPALIIAASALALLLIGAGAVFARSRLRDDAPADATGAPVGGDSYAAPNDGESVPTSTDELADQHSDTRDHD